MTDQTDAPERVWMQNDTAAHRNLLAEYAEPPHADVVDSFTAYVRADLHDAAQAEIVRLRAALVAAEAMAACVEKDLRSSEEMTLADWREFEAALADYETALAQDRT